MTSSCLSVIGHGLELQILNKSGEHRFRPKIFLGDSTRGLGMLRVIRAHRLQSRGDLLYRIEGKQTLSGWQSAPEAGILGDDRLSSGQVICAAVAEPAGAQPDIQILGDGELGVGPKDVVPKRLDLRPN